ncbi:MAG TPA: hypothetical protein VF840_02055 [Terriglobales bacterium]
MKRLGLTFLLLFVFGLAPSAFGDASCPFVTYVPATCTAGSCQQQVNYPVCGTWYGSLRECSNTAGLVFCCGSSFDAAAPTRTCGVQELRLQETQPLKLNAGRRDSCPVLPAQDPAKSTKP